MTLFNQHAQHAQCVAAQGERIFFARWLQADAPDADQGFELVGQRDGGAGLGGRQRVAGKAWLIVLGGGQRHGIRLAIVTGVIGAHDALQLREFTHHVGQQIGLGQFARRVRPVASS